ncbi:hypothetical protein [Paenibacillus macerans]|uniref:Uncharacterized protein n=1 Tax=Paenibacillus macerans TaxID=44252 RepID=A0A090Y323_PAEMA|nr:hypothetical protein [Paenibacillus macerans]KFM93123.1 hypothetical protein DJ90_2914 [Paenibacillus macerans]MCY7558532.1 hypothetical protein [Paenibacillus macerans]MEC0153960.1 hypothetical protein [Paenibacillus macerans]SUA84766.1 Uncharacterised protein [Paenibacillus macerans]
MKIKFTGLDKMEKQLKKFEKNARELEQTGQIPFDELFISSFMQTYTDFSDFDELLSAGGFVVDSQQDFENIPDEEFDKHISKHTKFNSWEDMLTKATENYISRKLRF